MSDLISRSELLKAMDTWDKFGYDEHNRLIRIDSTNEEYVPYVHYEDMVNCVMNMPTAYDIDKVVEELEKLADENYKAYCIAFNSADRAEYDAYTNAIEIFKHEGGGKESE